MKKTFAFLLSLGLAVSMLAGCGSKTTQTEAPASTEAAQTEAPADSASDDTYKIGVIQYVQHDALDASNEGFFAALDDLGISYEADQQNAAGEASSCQTIAETLVNNGNDLIFAIATPAAQSVAGVTTEIPIVLTAVTDPAESGLVESNDAPGGNVTGTSDLTPVTEQIDLLKELIPEAKTVGILYCSAESNSVLQAEMAKEACEEAGLASEDYTVSSSNEIQTVVESMIGKVDAIYAPTDNMIAAGMATVAMVANENKIPVICGEEGMVKEGGFATYGINYYELGYKAGEMAAQILTEGADPAEMPIGYLAAEECSLMINGDTAETLGIDVSSYGDAVISGEAE
ncbi:MAG: ABC transporter substrate-binding protein [Hominisplanchenecus sp.]|nr:ABC transporter substrate-binding protein [Lachnospiraceae bacterium]MDY2820144.1 ABC transporter substrate-binding protein [Hominisplanchenecus sp.]